jgi:hypothetical protein
LVEQFFYTKIKAGYFAIEFVKTQNAYLHPVLSITAVMIVIGHVPTPKLRGLLLSQDQVIVDPFARVKTGNCCNA